VKPGQAGPGPHHDRHVLPLGEQWANGAAQVTLAVGGVFEELPVLGQVAPGRPDVPGGRHGEHGRAVPAGQPAVNRPARDHHVVTGHGVDRPVDGLQPRTAVLQINGFVAGGVPVQVAGDVSGGKGNPHVVIGEQQLPAEHQVTTAGQVGGAHVARHQRMVRRGLAGLGAGDPLALHDRRRRVHVVEQRGVGDKAFLAHQLLGVQAAIGAAETHVALAGNLPGHPVVRHIVSFDAKIARPGRPAAARRLDAARRQRLSRTAFPCGAAPPACRERRCSFDYRRVLCTRAVPQEGPPAPDE